MKSKRNICQIISYVKYNNPLDEKAVLLCFSVLVTDSVIFLEISENWLSSANRTNCQ